MRATAAKTQNGPEIAKEWPCPSLAVYPKLACTAYLLVNAARSATNGESYDYVGTEDANDNDFGC